MLTRLKCTIVVLLLFILPATVFAGGFSLSGIGSRALSMGGAFRGVADDFSAAYWNPAGISQLEGSSVSGVFTSITPTLTYTPDVPELGTENGLEVYAKSRTFYIPNVNVFMRLGDSEKLTYGLGVYVPHGLGTEWNTYAPPPGFGGESASFPEFNAESEIQIIDIHPTLGIRFNDLISAGLGISINKAMMEMRRTYYQPTGFPYSPYDHIPLDMYLEGDGWGYGFNVGLLLTPNDKLRIGLALRSGSKVSLEGEADLDVYFPTTDNETFNQLAPELFTGAKMSSTADAEADFHVPTDLGLGISYKVTPKWLISMDINQTYWATAMDKVEIELSGNDPMGQPLGKEELLTEWNDTVRFSMGTEYNYNKMFDIRAGYYYDPTPIPNKTFRPTWADLGDKNSFNFGVGLKMNPVNLDINYEYILFNDREIITNTYDSEGQPINRGGKYTGKLHFIGSAITYNF